MKTMNTMKGMMASKTMKTTKTMKAMKAMKAAKTMKAMKYMKAMKKLKTAVAANTKAKLDGPWHTKFFYGGLAHLDGKKCFCVYCKKKHSSPRWWGRERAPAARSRTCEFLWCNVCHTQLWRSVCRSATIVLDNF